MYSIKFDDELYMVMHGCAFTVLLDDAPDGPRPMYWLYTMSVGTRCLILQKR